MINDSGHSCKAHSCCVRRHGDMHCRIEPHAHTYLEEGGVLEGPPNPGAALKI